MVTIERIGPGAFERARAMRLCALRDAPDAFWVTAEEEAATTAVEWRDRLARPDAATFVASRDGADVGLAVGACHHTHEGDAGLYAMWVAPEARGSGVATALIDAVVEWARAGGCGSLRLEVGDTNEKAVRLYSRLGFVPTGVVGALPAPREDNTEHERALDLRSVRKVETMSTTRVLPYRAGERPATGPAMPHQQLDQIAPVSMQEELWRRMTGLEGVSTGRSGISLPDSRALHLDPQKATGPPSAYLVGTEFAHLHGAADGSLHAALSEGDAAEAIDKGWAEPHPLARHGALPATMVMLYGPRDEAELETVWQLVQASHAFAQGGLD